MQHVALDTRALHCLAAVTQRRGSVTCRRGGQGCDDTLLGCCATDKAAKTPGFQRKNTGFSEEKHRVFRGEATERVVIGEVVSRSKLHLT